MSGRLIDDDAPDRCVDCGTILDGGALAAAEVTDEGLICAECAEDRADGQADL